jgi:hypothetical protein
VFGDLLELPSGGLSRDITPIRRITITPPVTSGLCACGEAMRRHISAALSLDQIINRLLNIHEVMGCFTCDDWIRDGSDLVIGLVGMTIDIFPRRGEERQIDIICRSQAWLPMSAAIHVSRAISKKQEM